MNHNHIRLFYDLNESNNINSFDLEVLKVIFMLGYSDKIEASSKNITALMISNINENPFELNKKIDSSLTSLVNESLIKKDGKVYILNNF